MALKETFAVDSIGPADERTRPPLEMADHPFADLLEVTGQIKFGEALAVTGLGPKLLVGLRNNDAHHHGGFCIALRPRRGCLARPGGGVSGGFSDFRHSRRISSHLAGRIDLATPIDRCL